MAPSSRGKTKSDKQTIKPSSKGSLRKAKEKVKLKNKSVKQANACAGEKIEGINEEFSKLHSLLLKEKKQKTDKPVTNRSTPAMETSAEQQEKFDDALKGIESL